MGSGPLEVKVWGDFACFTRPEFTAERVSYEVMTPSAARGVLEAIFWKPEMRWRVLEIAVLNPVRRFSILRNEMNTLQSERAAKSWDRQGGGYYADEDRAQRHSLCLKDVAYIIRAEIDLKPHADAHLAKYRDQFRRRVKRGQCFYQPYLGVREFSAFFAPPSGEEEPVELTDDLGLMLFDIDYERTSDGQMEYVAHGEEGPEVVQANAKPEFFRARLERGVLRVPQELYGRSEP